MECGADLDSTMDDDEARARSKSPLVNSSERNKKCQRTDISIPLAAIPGFPTIISSDKGKGKGGEVGKDNGKGGYKA